MPRIGFSSSLKVEHGSFIFISTWRFAEFLCVWINGNIFFPLCIARRRGNLGQHSINFWGVWREFDLSNHSMIWANVRSDRKMYVSVRQVTGLEITWPQAEAGGWHCDRSIWRYPHRPVAALLCHPSPILNMPAIFHKNWNAQWQDIHIKISGCVHFYM